MIQCNPDSAHGALLVTKGPKAGGAHEAVSARQDDDTSRAIVANHAFGFPVSFFEAINTQDLVEQVFGCHQLAANFRVKRSRSALASKTHLAQVEPCTGT